MLYSVIPEHNMFLLRPGRCFVQRARFLQEPNYSIGLSPDCGIPTAPQLCWNRVDSECDNTPRDARRRRCQLGKTGCTAIGKHTEETKTTTTTTKLETLDFRGFAPGEIKVKVTDDAVLVHGRHEHPQGSYEVKRSLALPRDAQRTGIVCKYVDGLVTVEQVTIPSDKQDVETDAEEGVQTRRTRRSHVEKKHDRCSMERPLRQCCKSPETNCSIEEIEAREAFEETMKNLSGIFSTMFQVPVVGSEDAKAVDKNGIEAATENKSKAVTDTQTAEKVDVAVGQATVVDEIRVEERDSRNETDELEEGETPTHCLTYDNRQSLENGYEDFIYVEKSNQEKSDEEDCIEDDEENGLETNPEDEAFAESTSEPSGVVITDVTDLKLKTQFEIQLDLAKYKAENIRVFFKDGDVTVEAEREVDDGYGAVEKMSRRIPLPANVDESKLTSTLSAQGSMSITAPLLTLEEGSSLKDIPIVVQ